MKPNIKVIDTTKIKIIDLVIIELETFNDMFCQKPSVGNSYMEEV